MTKPRNIRPHARPQPNGASHPPEPPQVQVADQFRRYADTPTFGFDLLHIVAPGLHLTIYRACSFVQLPNGVPARAIPVEGGFLCLSEAEADAFQQQVKADAQKPKLIVPGSAGFQKPPHLH